MEALRRIASPLLFVLFLSGPVFAQAGDEAPAGSDTLVVKQGDEFQISQRIVFPPVLDTIRYEIEIEQFSGGTYIPLDLIHTETNSITVSLRAGSYRYRITAYNKMNLLEGRSDWQNFEILPAVEPAAETYQPFYNLYYGMIDAGGYIIVTGRDFSEASEFALVEHGRNIDWSGKSLDRRGVIIPSGVTVNDQQTQVILDFADKKLKRGDYNVFIRNPGGLWTTLGKVRVGSRKNTGWTFSYGWSPMLAAFNHENVVYHDSASTPPGSPGNEQGKLDAMNWRGSYMRLGWLPIKTRVVNAGLEAEAMFLVNNELYATQKREGFDSDIIFDGLNSIQLNFLFQFPVNERWQHVLRLGAGGGDAYNENTYDSHGDNDTDKSTVPPVLINLGLGSQYFIWKNLYVEGGLALQFMLGVNHLMIRPVLGLGWQFGRWGEWAKVKKALDGGEDPSAPVTGFPKNEFTLAAGWAPMIPLGMDYSQSRTDHHSGAPVRGTTLLWPVTPQGAYFRAAYLPHRWDRNKLGMELDIYILDFPNRREWAGDDFDGAISFLSHIHLAALYQRKLTENWQLNGRIGAGISNPYDFRENAGSTIPFSINGGLSAQYFFWRGFYAEAGLDLFVSLGRKTHWMLHPGIGIGWQFNRDAETGLNFADKH
ncbi:MAG: porin family protein [Spirochaetaceae bacterium]|jgi:hypothetical protein|nr:porin family protein [Spirochaetaceae bacterium]